MNRIDRVTAILVQLQSRKVVKAQDIAERFNISLRTVYRDIKTLEEAGIPVIGEAGVGYSIMEGYRLPPVMFTRDEATAFLTAEKMIEKLTDSSTGESYKSAMYKIRSVLRSTEKDFLENLDENIDVVKSKRQLHQPPITSAIQTILNSIGGKNVLTITYFAQHSQQQTERNIEPIGIFYLDTYWHLVAYCRLRKDYRDFRVDRISEVQVTKDVFEPSHPTLKDYLKQMSTEKDLRTIVVRVDKSIAHHLDEQKYYSGFISQKEIDGQVEMTFVTAHLQGFTRWFMSFADQADIVSPKELKSMVRGLLEKNMKRLEG